MRFIMNCLNILLLSLTVTQAVRPIEIHSLPYYNEFREFMNEFNKTYSSQNEMIHRYNIFADNMRQINDHNIRMNETGDTFEMGVTPFTDLTNQEFKRNFTSCLTAPNVSNQLFQCSYNYGPPPVDFSWLKHQPRVVTPIKNQQQCGSCWAFSTTGSVESAHAIKTGKLISLSEQQLVDCSNPEGNQGCMGGLMTQAFQYIIDNNGICSEKEYPYTAADGNCRNCTNVVNITGYKNIQPGNEEEMKIRLLKQPLSIAIQADLPSFQNYKRGVYHDLQCNGQIDHGVLAVGYGRVRNRDYWIVKNSWGPKWGDKGYVLIARNIKRIGNTTFPNGMCQIASNPSIPII